MKFNCRTLPLIAVALGVSGVAVAQGNGPSQPFNGSSAAYAQDYDHDHHDQQDWDNPPQEFREAQRKGYHDGVEGARKDFDNHRRPEVSNRDEYRHPNVPRSEREDYREGFRRGYEVAMNHMMGGGYVPR